MLLPGAECALSDPGGLGFLLQAFKGVYLCQ